MIIKSLKLENIRSYNECTIDFDLGTTLFEGDIGSGKTTILMALEFALFGLGSEKGIGLLRTNEKKGSVTLNIEINGKWYEIYRCLEEKKHGKIQQTKGYIKSDEGIIDLSTSEMKEKILEILDFNEPTNPKSNSVIYRYAVFTPQEEMKEILGLKPDDRLQTFRKILGIENYRIAINNCSKLISEIQRKKDRLIILSENLEIKKKGYKQKKKEEKEIKNQLEMDEITERKLKDEKEEKEKEIEEQQKEKGTLDKLMGENSQLKERIDKEKKNLEKIGNAIDSNQKIITEELSPKILDFKKVKIPTTKSEEVLNKEKESLETKIKANSEKISYLNSKIDDYNSIRDTQTCPTCDRPANFKEYQDKINQLTLEKNDENQLKDSFSTELKILIQLIKDLQGFNKKQDEIDEFQKKKEGIEVEIKKLQSEYEELKQEIDQLNIKYTKNLGNIETYDEILKRIKQLQKEQKEKESEYTKIAKKNAGTRQAIDELKKNIRILKEEILEEEKYRIASKKLSEYVIWLKDFFVQTLINIETQVFMTYNLEFNAHFQKWWNLLVDDVTKEIRVDDNFTPMVEQDKYEQEIRYLSGGEKTSIALSYRLALNNILQEICKGLKSNLLILDEPTDGFSKEQLLKIREVLNEINCPQVIIVSHEKELESFADHIFRITKNNGVSEIT